MKIRKLTSLLLGIVIFTVSFSSGVVNSEESSITRKYYIYNYAQDSEVDNYDLSITQYNNGANSRGIIGTEDRVLYTNSGIVSLNAETSRSSGFIIDDHTIVTAAHCVFNKNKDEVRATLGYGSYKKNMKVTLFDSEGNVLETVQAVEAHIPELYKTCTDLNQFKYDYALLTVNTDLSEYEHFELGTILNNCFYAPISACGYPAWIENDNGSSTAVRNQLYIGGGNIVSTQLYTFNHNVDITDGQSGGPVFVTNQYRIGDNESVIVRTAVGIIVGSGTTSNTATRITPELLQFYRNNHNFSY